MKPRFRLYIFDLDGTLVDSFDDIAHSVQIVFQELELPSLAPAQIKGFIGQGARWLLQRSLEAVGADAQLLLPRARELFLDVYRANIAVHTQPFPGVVETLQKLQNQGAQMTVCTNKPVALAVPLLEQLHLHRFFGSTLGGDSLPNKKPHPAPLLQLMEQSQIPPSETLMVGDSQFDIEAGKSAHTATCGVTYGHCTPAQMQTLAPDWIIHQFSELPLPFPDPSGA